MRLRALIWSSISFAAAAVALAQPSGPCTVSVLNQSAEVRPDGSWIVANVPTNLGRVRGRMTCLDQGVTRTGTSDFFTVSLGRMNAIPPIVLGSAAPTPTRLVISTPRTTLTTLGETTQLAVEAFFADGSRREVSPAALGTTYSTTNPRVASVNADGEITALGSGRVLVTALNESILASIAVDVVLSGDRDGDGLADDLEIANGLDPNDPVDAFEDLDGDGLTNARELLEFGTGLRSPDSDGDGLLDGDEVTRFGTNPALFDTDGDGLSDGLEILTGSDPLDPASYDLSRALSALVVSPPSFILKTSPLFGEVSRQLTVTGQLIDGRSIDLTSPSRGTNYTSNDLSVCSFGPEVGRVFAGADGACTITVSNSGATAVTNGLVRTSAPTALSVLEIPGYANNVDVVGELAYVAAGEAGLVVVDVADRSAPRIVAMLDTPGNANDVRVSNGLAYVADGVGGLRVLDISDPLAPVERGALAPFDVDFRDVVVRAGVAALADANGRLWRINVTTPTAPTVLDATVLRDAGAFDVHARGVALSEDGSFAVVAADISSGGGTNAPIANAALSGGLTVIDLLAAGGPEVVGSVATGNALDVVLEGRVAYVADLSSSLTVVSLASLAAPTVVASTPSLTGGLLQDVEIARGFAFGADVFFTNSMPIIAVSGAAPPEPRAILDFSAFGDDFGSGIAVDGEYVYRTAGFALGQEGSSGGGRLYIGRYLEPTDDEGVPPTVVITSPANGTVVVEGSTITVTADARDDIAVATVEFRANGTRVANDSTAPYTAELLAPAGVATLPVDARAIDFGGNPTISAPVEITVVEDPRTTVVGRVLDAAANPFLSAVVEVLGMSAPIAPDGTFSIPHVPTTRGPLVATASATVEGQLITASSAAVDPVVGGITDVGTIFVQLAACARGTLTFDPFLGDSRVILQCRQGPVDFAVDLLRELVRPSEIVGHAVGPNEELVGTIVPDAAGRFCANLRPQNRYFLRREDVLCDDGVVRSCSATIERVRNDISDTCQGAATQCEDLATVVFDCDFFGGS